MQRLYRSCMQRLYTRVDADMTLFKNRYRVESTCLTGWDYASAGAYFVTLCTRHCKPVFSNIRAGEIVLRGIVSIAAVYRDSNDASASLTSWKQELTPPPNVSYVTGSMVPLEGIGDEGYKGQMTQQFSEGPQYTLIYLWRTGNVNFILFGVSPGGPGQVDESEMRVLAQKIQSHTK